MNIYVNSKLDGIKASYVVLLALLSLHDEHVSIDFDRNYWTRNKKREHKQA